MIDQGSEKVSSSWAKLLEASSLDGTFVDAVSYHNALDLYTCALDVPPIGFDNQRHP